MFRCRMFVLAVLCSMVALGHGDEVTTKKSVIIAVNSEPLTNSPTTNPSTDVPTTENPSTNPEPVPDHNTTTTTTSTTKAPEPDTTTTTTTSTTTTTPGPSPAPTPLPPPTQGTWTMDQNNVTCIVVQFAAQFNVSYTKDNSSIAHVQFNVPSNASVVNGSCADSVNSSMQWITLSWPGKSAANNFTIVFQRNETTKNYAVKYFNVTLSPDMFSDIALKTPVELYHGSEWMTPLATSYRCAAPTVLNMTAEPASVVATLTLEQLQEEAFRTSKGTAFSAARECGGGDVPDAVPIAVGCALGGLVVVVLVAYLAARRRSAARGYLSM